MESTRFPRGRARGNPSRPVVPVNQGAPRLPQNLRQEAPRQDAPRQQTPRQQAPRQQAPRPQSCGPIPLMPTGLRPRTPTGLGPQAPTGLGPQAPTGLGPQAQTGLGPPTQTSFRPPKHKATRPQTQKAPIPFLPAQSAQSLDLSQQVEQVTQGVGNISTEQTSIPVGFGKKNDRTLDMEKLVIPRPTKSVVTGKQGSFGTSVKLYSNYFPIKSYTTWALYQYRVDFSPEEDRINVQKGLLSVHKERLGAYIFDGTMLFSSKLYEPRTIELISKRSQDDQIVKITVMFTTMLESCHYAHIQVFNLILRNCLRGLDLQQVGRNFYDANAEIRIPDHRLVLWPGYETSIGLFDSGLLMRSEISTKVLREDTVYDFFVDCLKKRHTSPNWLDDFKVGIIGEVVMTRYNNETYKVDDVDEFSNTLSTFTKKDGSKMSYIDYYKTKWNITLRGNKQPLLISKKKKAFTSDKAELVYLVPELCSMTGFSEAMRNNFNTMKAVAEHTRFMPSNRVNRYYKFIQRVKNSDVAVDSLTRWGLSVIDQLVEIKGRHLGFEKIYSSNVANPYNCGPSVEWSRSVRERPMFKTACITKWLIICPNSVRDIESFVRSLLRVSKLMNFELPTPQIIYVDSSSKNYIDALEETVIKDNPPFVMCILLSSRSDVYCLIKKCLCVNRATPSQVVLAKHVTSINMSVLTKIAIQINCKLGGAPWSVAIPLKRYMIIGFDVCHDKRNKNISYGAVVATTNDNLTSFFSCVQRHESGQELSAFFGSSMIKALGTFYKLNNYFPKGIIVYRDGVGDGQLSYVYSTEVLTIKRTCKEFCKEANPVLVFVVVKKRINTRFFLEQSDKSILNPQPGTVVDTVVTDPSMYDFFLISQSVNCGTVTPTHYNIIEDTSNISADNMQRLTYKLTHMYFNWSGTVSVPAVCQLAHKLAFLTAQSLKQSPNPSLDQLLYFL